jgi:multicomponent Na+:H+ antiporter subunit A
MLGYLTLSPFLIALLAIWAGRRSRRAAALAIWPAILAIYFGTSIGSVAASGPLKTSIPWAEALGLTLSFNADGLALLFAAVIAGIGALIVLFSSSYFGGDARAGRFQATLFAFMGSMLGVVLSDNLFALFVFWELTGFTSFLLIGFDQERADSRRSALQALIVTGTGGMGLLAAAVLVELATGSSELSALIVSGEEVRSSGSYPWIAALVLVAAFTKSAQTPFHFWLPNAMAAPTPVSAYLHSATMVKAGLYLVARMTPLIGGTELWTGLTVSAGGLTMLAGAWRAVAETDLKRVLAYSTVSALGLMMMLFGLGSETAATAGLVYLLAHASYKGTLFLVAGTLEHETGTRDVTALSGLGRSMPSTALAGVIGACSMAGVPLLLGFVGKELVYEVLASIGQTWSIGLLAATVLASSLLGVAGFVAGVSPFVGSLKGLAPSHGVPVGLAAPPLLLAAAGVLAGMYPQAINLPVRLAVSNVTGQAAALGLAIWHGINLVLLLSLVTLAGTAALYIWRVKLRERIWPRSLGTERLYTGTLALLDQVSSRSLPALQSASLRSYVLVLILTAAVLTSGALAWRGLPVFPHLTPVTFGEGAVAVMIIAGAVSAVRARSTIAAVLSLGVTGYGVALTFLFFGAPDLAMTQFSVETLTAVIFTMVFYHFRRFRSLSPNLLRLRDLTLALLFGGAIALVLLLVGTTPTPAKLGRYFAENSATLAHGRNIVNVILVDFRAMDTMGEITVLATAALGVWALLKIGRRDEGGTR